jgi:hypothetical protein
MKLTWDDFEMIICPKCSIHFAVTTTLSKLRRKDQQPFYCPIGHGMHWPEEKDPPPTEDKELKELRRMIDLP